MNANPLGELDMELDAILEAEERERWENYRSWVITWTVEVVVLVMVGVMTAWTGYRGGDTDAGVGCCGALAIGIVALTVLGWRARQRWAAAHAMLSEGR